MPRWQRRGRYGNNVETAASGVVVLLVDARGVRARLFAVPKDHLDVRAIPPETETIHSPAGDRPGRAVSRRGVPPRERRLKHGCVSRTAVAGDPAGRQDEALGTLLGDKHHGDDDRLHPQPLARPLDSGPLLRRQLNRELGRRRAEQCDRPARCSRSAAPEREHLCPTAHDPADSRSRLT